MKVLACCPCASIPRHAKFLSRIHFIANLDINAAKVHIRALVLVAIRSAVFYSDISTGTTISVVVHLDDFTFVFCSKDFVMLRLDVNALVHLLLGGIHRILVPGFIGSSLIPNGEVTSINSLRFKG